MLTVICFKWQSAPSYHTQFEAVHVNTLRAMVARHYPEPHRFVCVTDDAKGIDSDVEVIPLWNDHAQVPNPWGALNARPRPSCYRRLKLFSAEAEEMFGPRYVCLDLDCVITRDMRPLWNRPEDFVIWADTARGTPYNGSMFLLRAGTRRQVWERFDPVKSPKEGRTRNYVGSDQAWIAVCLGPREARWTRQDGVYSFRNELSQGPRKGLPENARVVMFHGRFNPWTPQVQTMYPWVREHYQ